jgi:hypothetical protein
LRNSRYVFDAFTQGRKRQWDRTDPKVEIVTKTLVSNKASNVLVRRRNQSHINLAITHISDAPKALFFQNLQQLRLYLQIHVANFVKENRAAMGDFKQSLFRGNGAGEGAFLVTE